MKQQALAIDLLEDCVFSARAATEGSHESLDRVPGAALLGAAAARIYGRLDPAQAFEIFHSGRLRFGDGLPWNGRGVGWPVPRCWHCDKTFRPDEGGMLVAERIRNFQHVKELPRRDGAAPQPRQLREGYVHADGAWTRPAHTLRMKTAIDPRTGRAREAQLFGYDSLERGQCFASLVEADDGFDPALFEQVIRNLEGEILLGRSRSAEYGRVRIGRIEAAFPAAEAVSGDGDLLTLWLLSDLALADASGAPVLQPDGEILGLPGADVLWDRTFLRARRYSPWNAARHGYDRERLVLEAGGVVTLRLNGLDRRRVAERLAAGVGLYRESGLGRVWIDPPLLAGEQPRFEEPAPAAGSASAVPEPGHPLVAWLKARAGIDWKSDAEEKARGLERECVERVERSRVLHGIPPHAVHGPSKSQWGNVLTKAKEQLGRALYESLFQGDSAVIKVTTDGWNIEIHDGEKYRPLAAWLGERLAPEAFQGDRAPAAAYAHFVRVLARRMQDNIDNRRI